MKKVSFIFYFVLGYCLFVVAQNSFASSKGRAYLGIAMLPFKISGVSDIDYSDWENYGLYTKDPSSVEGRVRLPLSDSETSGLQPGLVIGYEYFIPDYKCSALGEFQYATSGEAYMMGFYAGVNYKFYEQGRFSLGIAPKIGYLLASVDLGTVQMMNHSAYSSTGVGTYVAPVITDEGTSKVNDDISADMNGFGFQLALTPSIQLNDRMSIDIQVGYSYGSFDDMEIEAGDITLQYNSPALVKPDGSSTQAGINPELEMSSIFITVNASIAF